MKFNAEGLLKKQHRRQWLNDHPITKTSTYATIYLYCTCSVLVIRQLIRCHERVCQTELYIYILIYLLWGGSGKHAVVNVERGAQLDDLPPGVALQQHADGHVHPVPGRVANQAGPGLSFWRQGAPEAV